MSSASPPSDQASWISDLLRAGADSAMPGGIGERAKPSTLPRGVWANRWFPSFSYSVRIWILGLPFVVIMALLTGLHDWLRDLNQPGPQSPYWALSVAYFVVLCYWLAIAPIMFSALRAYPLPKLVVGKHLVLHSLFFAVAAVVFLVYLWAADMLFLRNLGPVREAYRPFFSFLRMAGPIVLTNPFRYYLPLAALGYIGFYKNMLQKRELEARSLEGELARARLQLLRTRLQPHFLFNTLHSISGLMREDVETADRMLILLSDLLRITLLIPEDQEYVALREELAHLGKYLEIVQARFKDRVSVHYQVSMDCMEMTVPFLLLQPIVENAVRHGVTDRVSGGVIRVEIADTGSYLKIVIEDNGPGMRATRESKAGMKIGISSTRERLQRLYGDRASLNMTSSTSGTRVSIHIPTQMPAVA